MVENSLGLYIYILFCENKCKYCDFLSFEGEPIDRIKDYMSKARKIIICLSRDDAAILTTLTARQLNPGASIVVSVREKDNVALVRQSGATSVVTSSDTVERLLGLSAVGPELGAIIQDLLTAGLSLWF